MVKIKVKTTKVTKKKFPVKFLAPETLQNAVIGESEVTDLDSLTNKKILLSLYFITKNPRHQNIRLKFSIEDFNNGVAKTYISQYEVVSYYLRRLLKRDSQLIEGTFDSISRDKIKIRYKSFIIPKSKLSRELRTNLRKEIFAYLNEFSSKNTAKEIFSQVINGTLQNALRNQLHKYGFMKFVEFRKIEIKK